MDKNFVSYADTKDIMVVNEVLTAPDGSYSDTLKLSNASNVTIDSCTITGGHEDCIDMNRLCSDVTVKNISLISGGDYCMTIKGGCNNIKIENLAVIRHGRVADIDLGNWSDQSQVPVSNVVLRNVGSTDNKPVHVRVLWADKPTVVGGNVKLVVYPKFIVRIYRFLRARNWVK